MSSPVCIDDFEILARKKLAKSVYDYYSSGANNELSLKDNCRAFQRYRFRPRVLRDVSKIDTSTRVLGTQLDIPVCVAATAMNRMAHPDGEVAVAKAASKMKTGFTLSSWATSSIEEIQDAEPDSLKWMQLYIYKDRELSKQIVTRAERSGFKALLLTVDTPVLGKRYNDVRNNFALPPHLRLKNIILDKDEHAGSVQDAEGGSGLAAHVKELVDPCLTWADITWLRNLTKLPIVLKGIVTREMAKEAVDHGVDGIVVSNHGARQLDGVPATIDALREVVTAVGGRCEVYLDGGVRTGNDVFKAMAFGAKAVFVGRPILWGLAYEGEEGVRKVLQMFKDEFVNTMQLMGCRNMDEVWNDDSLVVPESYFKPKL